MDHLHFTGSCLLALAVFLAHRFFIRAAKHGATVQSTCFRISGVPQDWSKSDLLDALRTIDKSIPDKKHQLALHPACSGTTQIAILSLDTRTECFGSLQPNTEKYISIPCADGSLGVRLCVDNHFYDLTPLNTPRGKIVAELVLPLSDLGLNVKIIVVWWQLLVLQATHSDLGEVVLLGKCGSRTYYLMTLRGSASCHTGITAAL